MGNVRVLVMNFQIIFKGGWNTSFCVIIWLVFVGVFGKQYGLVLIITSMIKPEILGHVVHFVFVRSSSS